MSLSFKFRDTLEDASPQLLLVSCLHTKSIQISAQETSATTWKILRIVSDSNISQNHRSFPVDVFQLFRVLFSLLVHNRPGYVNEMTFSHLIIKFLTLMLASNPLFSIKKSKLHFQHFHSTWYKINVGRKLKTGKCIPQTFVSLGFLYSYSEERIPWRTTLTATQNSNQHISFFASVLTLCEYFSRT